MDREGGHPLDVGEQALEECLPYEVKDPYICFGRDEKNRLGRVKEHTLDLALDLAEHSVRRAASDLVHRHRGALRVRADGSDVISLGVPRHELYG